MKLDACTLLSDLASDTSFTRRFRYAVDGVYGVLPQAVRLSGRREVHGDRWGEMELEAPEPTPLRSDITSTFKSSSHKSSH